MERLLGLFGAHRRRDVGGDATVAAEAAVRVEHGPAARGHVDRRSIGGRSPVDEAAKRLVCFERRDVSAPLLGLLRDVGGEIPSHRPDPAGGIDAERGELLGDPRERVVRASLPDPIRGRLGVVAESLLALPQRLHRASLSGAQGSDKECCECKHDRPR